MRGDRGWRSQPFERDAHGVGTASLRGGGARHAHGAGGRSRPCQPRRVAALRDGIPEPGLRSCGELDRGVRGRQAEDPPQSRAEARAARQAGRRMATGGATARGAPGPPARMRACGEGRPTVVRGWRLWCGPMGASAADGDFGAGRTDLLPHMATPMQKGMQRSDHMRQRGNAPRTEVSLCGRGAISPAPKSPYVGETAFGAQQARTRVAIRGRRGYRRARVAICGRHTRTSRVDTRAPSPRTRIAKTISERARPCPGRPIAASRSSRTPRQRRRRPRPARPHRASIP